MSDSEQSCPPSWNEESSPQKSCAAAASECANPIIYIYTLSLEGHTVVFVVELQGTELSPQMHFLLQVMEQNVVSSHCPCDNGNQNKAPRPPSSFVGLLFL